MKNKLSYTAVTLYKQCPRAYYYQYIAGYREKTIRSALVFGNAMDEALNEMLVPTGKGWRQVYADMMTKANINYKDEILLGSKVVKYLKSDFDLDTISKEEQVKLKEKFKINSIENYMDDLLVKQKANALTEDEQDHFNEISLTSLKGKGTLMLEEYEKSIIPRIKRVISSQQHVYLQNEEGDALIGKIDLICEWEDGKIILFDNKTSTIKYGDDSVKGSKQLATYLVATQDQYKIDAQGYIVLEKKIRKKDPRVRISVIIDKVDDKIIEETFQEYDEVNYKIKLGEFPRTPESCVDRSGKCKYQEICCNGNFDYYLDVSKELKAKR